VKIPSLVLKQLYTHGSLENTPDGVVFGLKNRLSDAVVTGINQITVDTQSVPIGALQFTMGENTFSPEDVSVENPIDFPLAKIMTVLWKGESLEIGKHTIAVSVESTPFGKLSFSVKDSIRETKEERVKVPYDREDDYSDEIISERQDFARSFSGVNFEHASRRYRLGSPGQSRSTASMRRAISWSRWPPPKARWWRPTIGASR
jgi:hydroxymethylglutaryl-CoA reductase (NADPH)